MRSRPPRCDLQDMIRVLLVTMVIAVSPSAAQGVAGFVEDGVTSERLVGATAFAPTEGVGAVTNGYGYFALPLRASADSVGLVVRYLGYDEGHVVVAVGGGPVRLRLTPGTAAVGAVTVEAGPSMLEPPGTFRLTARDVERAPALLGEADPLKALQLSPAVRFGSEGSTGLHVRGSSPDQTLLLLDGAPVYNAAHLAGAVSVFNSDALQSVALVPGAPPARYGGRLAAVVDVATREGSRDAYRGTATVGLLASRALAEGPLGARGSFLVAARRTYADVLLRPFVTEKGSGLGYGFYDATAKLSVDLDDRTRLFASAYGGSDRFYTSSEETFDGSGKTERSSTAVDWGNTTATVRATRVLGDRAFVSALAYYSRYGFAAEREAADDYPEASGRADRAVAFRQSSGLRDFAVRSDLQLAAGPHAVEAGAILETRAFRPASVLRSRTVGADAEETVAEERIATLGGAVYVSDAVRVGAFRTEGGLRLGWLAADDGMRVGLQPRVAVAAVFGLWTARASAGRTWQPIHLLSNPGVGLPTDLWVPANGRLGPETAWQVAAGLEHRLGRWTTTVGGFAKTMDGLIEYADGGAFFASGERWDDAVVTASGTAYGLEVGAVLAGSRHELRVGYGLTRSSRRSPDIDAGRTFPYRYDRTHDLSALVTRHLSVRRRLTAQFVVATGAALTVPVARYGARGYVYGARNGARLPPYHRVDVAYEVDYGQGRLALGLYNVYNRLNPYYVEFVRARGDAVARDRFRFVSLFPILPSVSYRFAF